MAKVNASIQNDAPASSPRQMLGLALCRYVLRLPPVVGMTHDEVVSWVGPTIQRYLEAPE